MECKSLSLPTGGQILVRRINRLRSWYPSPHWNEAYRHRPVFYTPLACQTTPPPTQVNSPGSVQAQSLRSLYTFNGHKSTSANNLLQALVLLTWPNAFTIISLRSVACLLCRYLDILSWSAGCRSSTSYLSAYLGQKVTWSMNNVLRRHFPNRA